MYDSPEYCKIKPVDDLGFGARLMVKGRLILSCVSALALLVSCSVFCNGQEPGAKSSAYEKALKQKAVQGKLPLYDSWSEPALEPKAALLCIHGLSLHRGTYEAFGREIAKAGIVAYAMDLRGFGQSKANTKTTSMDFDGCLADIKEMLAFIHKRHPGLPVVLLGESMGGAVALRAAALYPDLVSGLISSAPARDRFSLGGESVLKVGSRVLTGGFGKPIKNVAAPVVKRVSSKEEVRNRWKTDPLMRTDFSARELMQFNEFMSKNLDFAREIKNTPTLFIVGSHDKLIKPAGTWKIYERLATANKQIVISKSSEHLIFENGLFNAEDISFVRTWVNNNVAALNPNVVASQKEQPAVVSSAGKPATTNNKQEVAGANSGVNIAASALTNGINGLNYWIEMYRDGKVFRCNNKTEFRSGDQIRFHVIPENDGYAYLVMRQGSSGKSLVLFPSPESGQNNFLRKGKDYAVPGANWMQFDATPGIENLSLVLSSQSMDIAPDKFSNSILTCYVSPEKDGAKDIVPTRMKLSWDDPKPVILPEDFTIGQAPPAGSLVRLVSSEKGEYLAVDIALVHR